MLAGLCFEQTFIAVEAIAQRLPSKDQLARTQVLLQGIDQTCQVGGPLLAGLFAAQLDLIALMPVIAALSSASFLSVLGAKTVLGLRGPGPSGATSLRVLDDLRAGIRTILGCSELRLIVLLTMLNNLMMDVLIVSLPAIIWKSFSLSPVYLGILNTVAGAVGVTTMALTPCMVRKIPVRTLGTTTFALSGVLRFLTVLSPNFWSFAILYTLLASAEGIFIIYIRIERARLVPSEVYGRAVGTIVMANLLPVPIAGGIVSFGAGRVGLLPLVAGMAGSALLLAIPVLVAVRRCSRCELSVISS